MKTHVIIIQLLLLTMSMILHAEDTSKEAKKAFKRGTALYDESRYAEAADEFRKAYQLRPSWKIFFNIGQCSAAAKQYGLALEAFEGYLSQGGDDVPKQNRDSALEEIRILREMVGYITVNAPDGATVTVDGHLRGTVPLPGPIAVGTGQTHKLEIQDGDEMLVEKSVRVNSGNTLNIDTMKQSEKPAPAEPTDDGAVKPAGEEGPPADEEGKPELSPSVKILRIAGWATVGCGVVSLGIMAFTGYKTYSIGNDENSDTGMLKVYQTTTNVLIGLGSTLVIAGGTMLAVSYISERRSRKESEGADVTFAPTVLPNGGMLSLSGTF